MINLCVKPCQTSLLRKKKIVSANICIFISKFYENCFIWLECVDFRCGPIGIPSGNPNAVGYCCQVTVLGKRGAYTLGIFLISTSSIDTKLTRNLKIIFPWGLGSWNLHGVVLCGESACARRAKCGDVPVARLSLSLSAGLASPRGRRVLIRPPACT